MWALQDLEAAVERKIPRIWRNTRILVTLLESRSALPGARDQRQVPTIYNANHGRTPAGEFGGLLTFTLQPLVDELVADVVWCLGNLEGW